MSNLEIGIYSIPFLLFLIFMRMPIGLAMLVVGLGGTIWLTDGTLVVLSKLKNETYSTFSNYSLSIVPLFLLMGQFATLGGMSKSLFKAAETWVGHKKGGVAMASIGACAGFGSICGSSLATAATMGQVALPELKRYGYSGGLSSATLAAGGTLGILIPPSVVLVIYAILAQQNIAKLFLAAFIPGMLAAIGYVITISLIVRFNPGNAQLRERIPYAKRFRALFDVWPVLLVFFMDYLSRILLTIPIFFPIISVLDFGLTAEETAIWFGILVLIVVEVGLITPPVGMNLFVINSMDPSIRLIDTYKNVIPFVASDLIRTVILVAFPSITLVLMRLVY